MIYPNLLKPKDVIIIQKKKKKKKKEYGYYPY